jgi:arginine/serine-rich splicing factor 16
MPWHGELIDRFDARAHLDYIPPPPKKQEEIKTDKISKEDFQLNYERFRTLAVNDFLGVSEDNFLKQIPIEEQFVSEDCGVKKDKKKSSQATATIG